MGVWTGLRALRLCDAPALRACWNAEVASNGGTKGARRMSSVGSQVGVHYSQLETRNSSLVGIILVTM